jgi:hypothetical protein
MLESGQDYTINTTGTLTDKLRFSLRSDQPDGILVRVLYDNVGSKTVKADGIVVQPQQFDDDTR